MDEIINERIRKFREQYGIPTAKRGARLFKQGLRESYVASVYPSNDIRALGFKSAADKLVGIAVDEPRYTDEFVYPIVYLYRMYIELRLKTIIEGDTQEWEKGHKLYVLWEKAEPAMKRCSQWFDDGELEAVEEKIKEFIKIDPYSDAGRYAKDIKGNLTFKGIHTIDLKNLKQVMDSISTPLESSYTAIYEHKQDE